MVKVLGTVRDKDTPEGSFRCGACGKVKKDEEFGYQDLGSDNEGNMINIIFCKECEKKQMEEMKKEEKERREKIDKAKKEVGLDCTKCPLYEKDRKIEDIGKKCNGYENLERGTCPKFTLEE